MTQKGAGKEGKRNEKESRWLMYMYQLAMKNIIIMYCKHLPKKKTQNFFKKSDPKLSLTYLVISGRQITAPFVAESGTRCTGTLAGNFTSDGKKLLG